MSESLQDRYGKAHRCFGCGPANPQGLQVKSRVEGDEVVADWMPQPHHEAFENALSGGICGTLLDCHSNWTAARHLMRSRGLDAPPSTVTAEFHVRLLRPTPTSAPVRLVAKVAEASGDRVVVEARIEAGGRVTATCRGVFVAVPEGHPAYHRW
jgi:acyl-coenzyme A thioesterase PaaI-like protein